MLADLNALTGKKVLLAERVDPTILGGAIARVGDTLIDGSVRRRLQLLRQQMQRGGMFTSQMDGVTGEHGVVNGAEYWLPATAHLRRRSSSAPPEADMAPDGGPASATEMAPRRGQAPHMAPQPLRRIIQGTIVPKIVVTLANADVADSDSVRRRSQSRWRTVLRQACAQVGAQKNEVSYGNHGRDYQVIRDRIQNSQGPSAESTTTSVGTVITVADGIARVYGLSGARYLELLEFTRTNTFGIAFNLEEDSVAVPIMGDYTVLRENDEVRTTGRIISVPVGDALIGRIVNPLG